uniref:COMM domain-containing protein n=1 Tax=Elaeophora elaphi TaxID=1147741 RepID=A0A0R3RG18_9BILA
MDVNLDPDVITEVWRSVRTRIPFDGDCINVDPKSMKELFSVLEELNRLTKHDDPNSVLECSGFSDVNKQHMLRLWRAKTDDDDDIKWGIDVVLANSNIRKSLYPKVWLVVDGQEIEMNLEVFAKLRFEVSRVLNRIDHYA